MFVDFNILNQLGSPSINSNTFANRPAAGQTGRLFVSTDTFEIYRDNGTTWDLIGGPGTSTITGTGTATQVAYFTSSQAIGSSANLFWDNTNTRLGIGTATPGAALDIHSTGIMAHFNTTSATGNSYIAFQRTGTSVWRLGDQYNAGANFFQIHNIALSNNAIEIATATNKSIFTALQTYTTGLARGNYFDYNLSVSAGGSFSSPNAITALGASLDLTLAGSATIPSGARSGLDAYNSISFTGAGTLTHGQGTQIRAYSNLTAGWAFSGSATGTVTHLAGLRALFPDNTGSAINVTNNYALLLNDQTANTGTVTYTNRWGVYQEGASDLNYMAANLLLGSTTNSGEKLQVTGNALINANTGALSSDILTVRGGGGSGSFGFMVEANNGADIFYTDNFTYNVIMGTTGGSVGIGTNAPVANTPLTLQGASGYTDLFWLKSVGTNIDSRINFAPTGTGISQLNNTTGTAIALQISGAEKMRLDSNGLGIGTTNTGPISANYTGIFINGTSGSNIDFRANNTGYGRAQADLNGFLLAGLNSVPITFFTGGSERARLTSGGNFLIGTTTDAGQRLQVSGDIYTFNSVGGGVTTNQTGNPSIEVSNGNGYFKTYKYTFMGNNFNEYFFSSNLAGGDAMGIRATIQEDGTNCQVQIGDMTAFGNGTTIVVNDATSRIIFASAGKYNFSFLLQFASNAAALAGGLTLGDIYRITGTGDLKIVI